MSYKRQKFSFEWHLILYQTIRTFNDPEKENSVGKEENALEPSNKIVHLLKFKATVDKKLNVVLLMKPYSIKWLKSIVGKGANADTNILDWFKLKAFAN